MDYTRGVSAKNMKLDVMEKCLMNTGSEGELIVIVLTVCNV